MMFADSMGQIETDTIMLYLTRMVKTNTNIVPEAWTHLTQESFENLCNTLDPNGLGKIEFKVLFS